MAKKLNKTPTNYYCDIVQPEVALVCLPIILMLTLTLKVTLKNPQLRPPKDSRGARWPIRAYQRRDRNFHFPRRTLWWGEKQEKSVWGPQSKCKHQIPAVESDLPCALVDITRLDSLLH